MIKVEGEHLWRGGVKIGYVANGHIFTHMGVKVGYCSGKNIYAANGNKLAYLEGDYVYFTDSSHKIRLEDIEQDVVGGSLSGLEKAAVMILLGE